MPFSAQGDFSCVIGLTLHTQQPQQSKMQELYDKRVSKFNFTLPCERETESESHILIYEF